jgi:hypothetical protein
MIKPRGPQEPKRVLSEAANARLQDAKALLKVKRYGGAVYLGGYVIECMLKVAICDYIGVNQLPGQYAMHDLGSLLRTSGLQEELKASAKLLSAFNLVLNWSVNLRYKGTFISADAARKFMQAVTEVREWLLSKRE